MGEFLTACRMIGEGLRFSERDGGITLTSAPVSTRKRVPVGRSVTKKRRLFWFGPVRFVAARPGSFPVVGRWMLEL